MKTPRKYLATIKKNKKAKAKTIKLRKNGLTIRQIAPLVGMSYEWVRRMINEAVDKHS
jgi:transposase-like protein